MALTRVNVIYQHEHQLESVLEELEVAERFILEWETLMLVYCFEGRGYRLQDATELYLFSEAKYNEIIIDQIKKWHYILI